MAGSWWDEVHWKLWRLAGRPDLRAVIDAARQVASDVVAPQRAAGLGSVCAWTAENERILASFDAAGLTSLVSAGSRDWAVRSGLAAWELAWVDGGAATLNLSGSLARMPVHAFGTPAQRERYLENSELRHGALCLTEPIPGAGTDAMFLSGSFDVADWVSGEEPILQIRKRGRFISHMDFAEFAVVAVQAGGSRVRGSCLVILEPKDAGLFDRGLPVRKLGHRLASTTNPVFDLRAPASRIVGGYTVEDGVLIPNHNHRRTLEPAFRRTRTTLSLMTAANLLSSVGAQLHPGGNRGFRQPDVDALIDLWATGEAAASLGFSAARACDELDCGENQRDGEADLLSSAAKLFSSSEAIAELEDAAANGIGGCVDNNPGSTPGKLMDAQIEALYLGAPALQRRVLSAAMTGRGFLRQFEGWIAELEDLPQAAPRMGIDALIAGMRLWHWTVQQLQQQVDARGTKLLCDARQGVTFPLADALCFLLAARSLTLDAWELERAGAAQGVDPAATAVFFDLCAVASIRAASSTRQSCAELLYGYDPRFPSLPPRPAHSAR